MSVNKKKRSLVERAKEAAIDVLLHNSHGPYRGLPRAAGWGYPEPYTRDILISSLGVLVSGNEKLIASLRCVLTELARNQSPRGHIPSLVHDPEDRGASDTTPLFLMVTGLYRKTTGEYNFLESAVNKSLTWMGYQSPSDHGLVGQLPTSDWRDEQWVLGYGLYVNAIVYTYLKLLGENEQAEEIRELMERFTIKGERQQRHVHEGLVLRRKPYYALWSYKVHKSERFDLLGNSLAILSGIASPTRTRSLISWIEKESEALRNNGDLYRETSSGTGLPPGFFPYIKPGDPDWLPRYEKYNRPGEYHNGGVWPFICGFYVAALVAAKRYRLAEEKLIALTELVKPARRPPLLLSQESAGVEFGFNEWLRAQDGTPQGEDWQSWSAAMYLYAADCVERKDTPFFSELRSS